MPTVSFPPPSSFRLSPIPRSSSCLGEDVDEGVGGDPDEFVRKNRFKQIKFALIHLLALQALFLCLLLRFSRYELAADASLAENGVPVALGGGVGRNEPANILRNFTFQVSLAL